MRYLARWAEFSGRMLARRASGSIAPSARRCGCERRPAMMIRTSACGFATDARSGARPRHSETLQSDCILPGAERCQSGPRSINGLPVGPCRAVPRPTDVLELRRIEPRVSDGSSARPPARRDVVPGRDQKCGKASALGWRRRAGQAPLSASSALRPAHPSSPSTEVVTSRLHHPQRLGRTPGAAGLLEPRMNRRQ